VVGYGPEPDGVVERLRVVGAIGIKGNHDDAACGGESIECFTPDARIAAEWTRSHMSEKTRACLIGLPERLEPQSGDFTLVHGSPRDPLFEYLQTTSAARDNLAAFATAYCLVGHTHVPLILREEHGHIQARLVEPERRVGLDERRAFLNPGSVGQPRDGDPAASYLLIDTGGAAVTWRRVAYDIEATQTAMLAAGLPSRLARRLGSGR
jgi:diadenosine tetraphosphatase ApaH/serine/threonine PP2A family protein phosphatase